MPADLPRLIGLTGKAGSGKDTAGRILAARWGYTPVAFAGVLKRMLAHLLGVEVAQFEDRQWKERPCWTGKSPREMLQTLGTEWGRELVHPDLWVMYLERLIKQSRSRRYVVTDLRFPNEAEMVRRYDGVIIQLVRDSAPAVAAHSSEQQHVEPHYRVKNNGTLQALEEALRRVIEC